MTKKEFDDLNLCKSCLVSGNDKYMCSELFAVRFIEPQLGIRTRNICYQISGVKKCKYYIKGETDEDINT